MFTSIADLQKTWKSESSKTKQIFDALSDGSLSQAVCEDHRTIGRMAWHIVTTIPEMCNQMGLSITSVDKTDPVPATAAAIRQKYSNVIKELLDLIKSDWNDETLKQEDNLYGESWARGLTMDVLMRHEIHHRGQITVLMRQADLKVPGIYGPSRDEWSNYDAKPPEI